MADEREFFESRLLEQFRSSIQIAILAMKNAVLINGAAAIALLTFLGNSTVNTGMPHFIDALEWYLVGVALAAFGNGTSYLAQYRYVEEAKGAGKHSVGKWFTLLTVIIVFSSYISFICGGLAASDGFSHRIL